MGKIPAHRFKPSSEPQIELLRGGRSSVLVEQGESGDPVLPTAIDVATTTRWIRQALAGEQPVPEPLVHQLACCYYAAGRAGDFNQALALARTGAAGSASVLTGRGYPS